MRTTIWTRTRSSALGAVALAVALAVAAAPAPAQAQGGGQGDASGRPGVDVGGLLIAGYRAEPEGSAEDSGFDLLHARLDVSGRTGLGVRYRVLTGVDPAARELELLAGRLTVPVRPGLRVTAGQFKAPFGREALQSPAQIQFATRSQGASALAPLWQVGAQLSGAFLDDRLRYRAGLFNGEGRTAGNADGDMLYAARVEYSRLGGSVQFYDELNVTVGANVAFSEDSARDVSDAGPFRAAAVSPDGFRGERLLLGGDLEADYRGILLAAEYLRAEYEPDPVDPPAGGAASSVAEGVSLEGGYKLWGGLVDLIGRWDAFDPPAADRREFLVFGANIYPGMDARIGVEYAARLDDSPSVPPLPGPGAATPAPSPLPGGWADGQFVLRLQTAF